MYQCLRDSFTSPLVTIFPPLSLNLHNHMIRQWSWWMDEFIYISNTIVHPLKLMFCQLVYAICIDTVASIYYDEIFQHTCYILITKKLDIDSMFILQVCWYESLSGVCAYLVLIVVNLLTSRLRQHHLGAIVEILKKVWILRMCLGRWGRMHYGVQLFNQQVSACSKIANSAFTSAACDNKKLQNLVNIERQ